MLTILQLICIALSIWILVKMNKKEHYPVTMSQRDWANYVGKGYNTLLAGVVIPSGTTGGPSYGGGAVYRGYVRQGWGSRGY